MPSSPLPQGPTPPSPHSNTATSVSSGDAATSLIPRRASHVVFGPELVASCLSAEPPMWQEIFRFLRNPHKPVILAMSRPDAKKNITTLVGCWAVPRW